MQGTSSDALAGSLAFFEEQVGQLPDGAGSNEVSEGLYAVADLLDREPSLRRAFTDPASTAQGREGLADNLLGQQLPPLPLTVFKDMVARRWNSDTDLREGVEQVAVNAAMRAVEGEGALDEVEDELFHFGRLLDREPALRQALTDRGLPADRKSDLLRDLLSDARPTTLRLLDAAVTRRRTGSLEHAIEQLSRLAAERRERYVARVRVAQPLDERQEQRLTAALARIYGREIDLQVEVDAGVLGGVEVRVGDEVINGTIARKLETASRKLAG